MVGEDVEYLEDPASNRLSVAFPVVALAAGPEQITMEIRFMCLSSDDGGISKRPTKVIFTMEDNDGQVLGRKEFVVRICTNPKRDKKADHRNLQRARDCKRFSK